MARIWLIRHGQSEGNAGLPSRNAASIGLTDIGRMQARAVAEWFQVAPARIVTSPYERARRTADALAQKFPTVPVVEWPVHEYTFLPYSAYVGTTPPQRQEAVQRYWADPRPHHVAGDGAESFAQFIDRVLDVRDRLLAEPSDLVVFSHKKFISALVWMVLTGEPKMSARRMRRWYGFDQGLALKNGAIVPLEAGEGLVRVLPVESGHLELAARD